MTAGLHGVDDVLAYIDKTVDNVECRSCCRACLALRLSATNSRTAIPVEMSIAADGITAPDRTSKSGIASPAGAGSVSK